jgi:hypothetical protein
MLVCFAQGHGDVAAVNATAGIVSATPRQMRSARLCHWLGPETVLPGG